jgi:hypothetical protein
MTRLILLLAAISCFPRPAENADEEEDEDGDDER